MKKLLLLVLSLCLVFTLAACGGNGDGEQPDTPDTPPADQSEDVIFSPDVSATIVRPDTAVELASDIADAILELSGKMPTVRDTASQPDDGEIVIGETDRQISIDAMAYLEANGDPTARLGCYLVYSDGKSIAIVATSDEALEKAVAYFIQKYVISVTLKVDAPVNDLVSLAIPPVDEAEWEARFDVYNGLIPDETISSLRSMYAMFDENTVAWLANLWEPFNCVCGKCDPDSGELACYGGGFYYANSARDYVGFLPDVESTSQLLGTLSAYGMLSAYGGNRAKALPEDMQAAIVKFVQSLQDPTDKYFYHPQWGKDINSSRRGRDLDSSLGVLRSFGAEPLYGSPLAASAPLNYANNLTRPLTNSKISAVSAVLSTSTLPDYLKSEEAFIDWLEALNINGSGRSYSAGHTISSIRSQIKAAGLDGVCIEWLNSKQLDNGLWESGEPTYGKTNGLLKISTMYDSWNVEFPRVEKGIDAFIAMLYSDTPVSAIVDIYNVWVGMNILVPNLKKFGTAEAYDALISRLYSDSKSIFDLTKAKLATFRKADGSFSYLPGSSASTSQGEAASLGFNEGDVNATALAHSTVGNMLAAFGLRRVDFYNNDHFELFLSIAESLTSVEKQMLENEVLTYDDLDAGSEYLPNKMKLSSSVQEGGMAATSEVLAHEDDPSDLYVKINSVARSGDSLQINIQDYGPTSCFILDTDIQFTGGGVQIFLGNSVMLIVNASGSNVVISDANLRSGASIMNNVATAPQNKWINLRIEHYPEAERTKYFIDGELVKITDNFMGKTAAGTTKPTTSLSFANFYVTISATTAFMLDNTLVDRTADKYVAPEGGDGIGDEAEKPDGDTKVTLPDGASGGSYYQANGGKDYSGTLNSGDYWTNGPVINGNAKDNPNGYAKVVTDGDKSAMEFAKPSDIVAERHLGWKPAGSGDVYVFETDFLYTGCILDNADPWPIRFGVWNSDTNERAISLILRIDTKTGDLKHIETGTVLKKGEWNNIAIRYTSSTGAYEFILNGETFFTGNAAAGMSIKGTSAELRAFASELFVYFDNTFTGFVAE